MIQDCLKQILTGSDLSTEQAIGVMDSIMNGNATPAQIAGLIIALKQKGETVEEVAGFVQSMRSHSVKIELGDTQAVDLVGTGGDGAHTFNVSTASALVTAAAGIPVAKHGNRSVSSRCGSADLLEALGGNIDPGPDVVKSNILEVGFGFMFAPRFHPAMKHAAEPRRELGVRTVFNILGPMTNPASVRYQVTGVYDAGLMSLVADVLTRTGSFHVIVAHSDDGLDEFSVSAPTHYIEIKNGQRNEGVINPVAFGLQLYPQGALRGGDAEQNAEILRQIFAGDTSAYRDAVVLNAGILIYVAGKANDISDGIQQAAAAIDTGKAKQLLANWREASYS